METSMATLLARAHRRHPRRTAVASAEGALTFAELQERVHRTAHALAELGVRRGDRVVLWLDNGQAFLEVEQAAFLCGYVRTALSPMLHVDEVAHIVEDCAPQVLLTDAERARRLQDRHPGPLRGTRVVVVDEEWAPSQESYAALLAQAPTGAPDGPAPGAEDLAALLYTSGTSGRPKAAMVTHRSWVAMVSQLWGVLPLVDHTDLVLHAGPMSHLSGSIGSACYVRGAATAMSRAFDPREVLRTVETLGVTVLPLVPTMLAALTAEAETGRYDVSSLRAVPYGGSAAFPDVLRRARDVFGEVLVQVYGLSEAVVPLASLSPADHRSTPGEPVPDRLRSAGRPTPFVDLRLLADDRQEPGPGQAGEVLVRGDTVMAGYWERPELTAEVLDDEGWLHTGDVGRVDEDGYLYVVDRKSDVIISGGINIYPGEVERVIASLPEVAEVVVVGAPDQRWVETVTAVVVVRPGHRLTAEEVIDTCRRQLAGYKKPTLVHFVDDLPRTSNDKPSRRQVRDRFRSQAPAPEGG